MRNLYMILVVLSIAMGACGGSMHQLNTLARDDLQCDHNLMITKIDEKTRRVEGCGKSATYTEVCNEKDECTWSREP